MNCTGNCYQGRACDCQPDVEEDQPAEPLTPLRALALIGIILVSGLCSIAVVGFIVGWIAGKLA